MSEERRIPTVRITSFLFVSYSVHTRHFVLRQVCRTRRNISVPRPSIQTSCVYSRMRCYLKKKKKNRDAIRVVDLYCRDVTRVEKQFSSGRGPCTAARPISRNAGRARCCHRAALARRVGSAAAAAAAAIAGRNDRVTIALRDGLNARPR